MSGGSRTLTSVPTTTKGDAIGVGVGIPPPPGAPIEVASGVPAEAKRIPPEARGNEQELAPLRGPKGPPLAGADLVKAVGARRAAEIEAGRSREKASQPAAPVVAAPTVSAAGALSQAAQALGIRIPRRRPAVSGAVLPAAPEPAAEPVTHADAGGTVQVAQHLDMEDVPLAPIQPHQRAASNTDSPSRGIPQPILDPGKKITGGFGELTDSQYHPLNGHELKTLVEALLDTVHARMQDDLRFSMAITYPRVRARVSIIVEGVADADGFAIEKVLPERAAGKPGSTPLALARTLGDEVVFVVSAVRQEFDDAGTSISPPNAIREELGLPIPRKQSVPTPTGTMLVDILT